MAVLIMRYSELGKPVTVAEHETVEAATEHALQLADDLKGVKFTIRGEQGELLGEVKRG